MKRSANAGMNRKYATFPKYESRENTCGGDVGVFIGLN
jgi:hypothetical protein